MERFHIVLLLVFLAHLGPIVGQWGGPMQPPQFGSQQPFGQQPFGQQPFGQQPPPQFGPSPFPSFPSQGPPGFGPFNPFFSGQGFPQQQFQPPQVLTCIGYNEANDVLKITLRPEPSMYGPNPSNQFGTPRELNRQDWRISAVYIPASSTGMVSPAGTSSLLGQFFLAITRYGRTDGHCAGLGGILQADDLINPGQPSRAQQFNSQFGNSMFGQTSFPAGFVQDPIVISQGGNVYSGVVRDLAEADLRGRAFAICLDYMCQRPTTTCCPLVKDSSPATEAVGGPIPIGPYTGKSLLPTGTSTGSTGSLTGSLTGSTGSTGSTGLTGGLF